MNDETYGATLRSSARAGQRGERRPRVGLLTRRAICNKAEITCRYDRLVEARPHEGRAGDERRGYSLTRRRRSPPSSPGSSSS